ncbi:MAG TPA: hypothetical protein VGG64_29075 [Pirellulales bacterium]|jgi:hypothetical protein
MFELDAIIWQVEWTVIGVPVVDVEEFGYRKTLLRIVSSRDEAIAIAQQVLHRAEAGVSITPLRKTGPCAWEPCGEAEILQTDIYQATESDT